MSGRRGAHPVLIAGGGPTGLALACQLLRREVPCRVVDKAEGPLSISRAIGLSPRSLEVLDECGVAERLLEVGIATPIAAFHSRGRCIGRLTASAQRGTRFPFMLAVPQWETERLLGERVVELGGSVERGRTLLGVRQESEAILATVAGPGGTETVEADWAVGADGAHSQVRKELGIAFPGARTSVVFVIVDAWVEGGPTAGEGRYYFSPEGLLVVVPLPDGSHRLAATVAREDDSGGLELDALQALVDRRVGGERIELHGLRDAGWGASQVRIHTRTAKRFRAGRTFLAGDAAHIYSPVGGQGLNSGVQDAHNLAWKLALVIQGRASPALLDSYEPERRIASGMALKASSRQTRLATVSGRLAIAARDALISRASRKGLLDRRMAPQIAQFDIDYGPTVARRPRRGVAGRRVPDTDLIGPAGTPPTVHGLLRGGRAAVLVLSPELSSASALLELRSAIEARHGPSVSTHTLFKGPRGALAACWPPIVDAEGALHQYLGEESALCVLRPDSHIAAVCPADGHTQVLEALARMTGFGQGVPGVQRSPGLDVEVSTASHTVTSD